MEKGGLYLWVTMKDCDKGQEIYDRVKNHKINVTEMPGAIYVHGNVPDITVAVEIISICEEYGTAGVELASVGR